ncbi:MAG: riboflavin synthase [Deltaproteobacteria bacterium]|jgi:riboflavin synthase|nr:riboflavin synthase [Deltaproteobacteria bacterium]
MFTGLIEDVGTILDINRKASQSSITVSTKIPMDEISLGESIAVNGACLTVTRYGDGQFTADVSPETLRKTTLGQHRPNDHVNLERALRLTDRLGGHLVTGHVDGCGRILKRQKESNAWVFQFQVDQVLMNQFVSKGSVAVDGISLTVNNVDEESVSVTVIPHTMKQTTLQHLKVGDLVNIETDLIGKYVARCLDLQTLSKSGGVSADLLAKHGFL